MNFYTLKQLFQITCKYFGVVLSKNFQPVKNIFEIFLPFQKLVPY